MKGLNFFCQPYGDLGIPIHTRYFAKALSKKIEDLRLTPLFEAPNSLLMRPKIGRPDKDYPSLCFWYPDVYPQVLVSPIKNFGYYIFEYTIIPPQYVAEINKLNGICTASQWGVEILKRNGVTIPCYVVPGGIEHLEFNSENRRLDPDIYRFLHIGKAESRKGTDLLINAFNKTFKGDPKIRLTLMIDNPHIKDFNVRDYVRNLSYSLPFPIDNIDVLNFVTVIQNVYRTHDCAVFPTKAEGIGLPIVEAMSCGLPVIVSNNSGITEYANKENSILLEDLKEEPVYDTNFFPIAGQLGNWMAPSEKELAEKMLWCYTHKEDAKKIGIKAEDDMRIGYTWEQAAEKFAKILGV